MDLVGFGLFVLTGALAGVCAGLFGIGGGIIYVPVLVAYLSTQAMPQALIPTTSVATSLAVILVSMISASLVHRRQGNLDLRAMGWLVLGGTLGVLTAAIGLRSLEVTHFKLYLALFELLIGARLLLKRSGYDAKGTQRQTAQGWVIFSIGALTGAVAAFFGVGGGLIAVPLLIAVGKMDMKRAVGTSIGTMVLLAFVALVEYQLSFQGLYEFWPRWGFVDLFAWAALVPSAFLFGAVGAKLTQRIEVTRLKTAFALLVILVGFYNLNPLGFFS